MLDYLLGQETFSESESPMTVADLFRASMPRLNMPELETEAEHLARVELMTQRFEQATDLYTGDPLAGADLADWRRAQAEHEVGKRSWELRQLNTAAAQWQKNFN